MKAAQNSGPEDGGPEDSRAENAAARKNSGPDDSAADDSAQIESAQSQGRMATAQMKAALYERHGPAGDVPQVADVETPEPGREVRVRMTAVRGEPDGLEVTQRRDATADGRLPGPAS